MSENEPGKQLSETAGHCAALGVFFPPLLIVAIVMGGAAMEKSGGNFGKRARDFSFRVLWVWLAIIFVVAALELMQ